MTEYNAVQHQQEYQQWEQEEPEEGWTAADFEYLEWCQSQNEQ